MDNDVVREERRDDLLRMEALRLACGVGSLEEVIYRAKLYYAFLSDVEFDPDG